MTHASGEKCATQLFTETDVGNASPAQWEREGEIFEFDQIAKSIVSCFGWW